MPSSKSALGAAKNIQNGPSPISTYPPFVRWPDQIQCQSSKKQPHLGEGLRTKIVFPADPPPPPPSLCAGSALRPKNCPVAVEFAAASARRCAAATVKFMMLGAPRLPSPNLLILRGWRAQTVKEKDVFCTVQSHNRGSTRAL